MFSFQAAAGNLISSYCGECGNHKKIRFQLSGLTNFQTETSFLKPDFSLLTSIFNLLPSDF